MNLFTAKNGALIHPQRLKFTYKVFENYLQYSMPCTLILYLALFLVAPGTDPTSVFDLVQFEVRKDQRVFITSKAKATSNTTSFEKINYGVKKNKEGYYYLTIKNPNSGEYFFGSSDFMFAFSVE